MNEATISEITGMINVSRKSEQQGGGRGNVALSWPATTQRVHNWSASGGATVYSMIHVNEPLKLMRSFATTTAKTTTRNEIRHDDEGWAILETSLCNLARRFFASSIGLH